MYERYFTWAVEIKQDGPPCLDMGSNHDVNKNISRHDHDKRFDYECRRYYRP